MHKVSDNMMVTGIDNMKIANTALAMSMLAMAVGFYNVRIDAGIDAGSFFLIASPVLFVLLVVAGVYECMVYHGLDMENDKTCTEEDSGDEESGRGGGDGTEHSGTEDDSDSSAEAEAGVERRQLTEIVYEVNIPDLVDLIVDKLQDRMETKITTLAAEEVREVLLAGYNAISQDVDADIVDTIVELVLHCIEIIEDRGLVVGPRVVYSGGEEEAAAGDLKEEKSVANVEHTLAAAEPTVADAEPTLADAEKILEETIKETLEEAVVTTE